MTLNYARRLASEVKRQLAPYTYRIDIGGSIRREKPVVKDIEIVMIPKTVPYESKELFNNQPPKMVRHPTLVRIINQWEKVKGDAINGKYMQREMQLLAEDYPGIPERSIKIDIFTATRENYGYIFAIRTGPDTFSHEVLAKGWVAAGYKGHDGSLVKAATGEVVPIPEEKDLFNLVGIKYIEPHLRK